MGYSDRDIQKQAAKETREYSILKTVEELNELSTALTQLLTKPKNPNYKAVNDEMGDVMIRLSILVEKKVFDNEAVDERIEEKLNHLLNKK